MRESFETMYRWYGRLLTALALAAAFGFFGMMWLIDANVFMRKLFNSPITGTLEITEALLVLAVLLPMAYTQMRRGHIRVTLLTQHLSPTLRRWLQVLALLVGFVFAAWATYATYRYFMRSYAINEHAWGSIRMPIYPVKGAVCLGMLLLSIQFLLDAVRLGVFGIEDDEFSDHGDDIDAGKVG